MAGRVIPEFKPLGIIAGGPDQDRQDKSMDALRRRTNPEPGGVTWSIRKLGQGNRYTTAGV